MRAGLEWACLLAALPLAASASVIYRWIDEQGQIHYGDRPPPGVETHAIPPPLPAGVGEELRQLQDYVRTLEVQDTERARRAELLRQQQQRLLQRRSDCEQSTARRARLDNPRQREYQADGNVRRLTEEERQARIAETEQRIADACSDTP